MKKILSITFLLFALNASSYSQIDAPFNATAIGLGATANTASYKFTYQNYSIAHYGLGWYTDQEATGSPTAYFSGYAGIKFFTSGQLGMYLRQNGDLGIPGNLSLGTTDSKGYKLAVNGNMIANSVTVKMYPWADFVFKKEYNLRSLPEVKAYIDKNHHLPEIPSELEVIKNGLDLGQMNKLLMQKVEELTLYLLEQHQQIETLKKENSAAQSHEERLKKLEKQLGSMLNK
jgi:hypothetical protein